MTVRPLHDRVLIKPDPAKTQTDGGIHIPDTAQKEKPAAGTVVAVGSGRIERGEVRTLDVKAGDRVLYGKYSGTEVKVDDEPHLIVREDDILAVLS